MELFGLTPIDSALSALGLNYCQTLMAYIFQDTSLGTCVFTLGFLFAISKSIQKGSIKPVIICFFLYIAAYSLIVSPHRDIQVIKSAQERYGVITPTTDSLKWTTSNEMPVLLSFIGQGMDAIFIGAVDALGKNTPDYANFLKQPYGIQRVSVNAHRLVYEGVGNISLKERVDEFVYSSYVPALTILKNSTSSLENLSQYGPTHEGVNGLYSQEDKEEWESLKSGLLQHMNMLQSNWLMAKEFLSEFDQNHASKLEDDLLNALIQRQARSIQKINQSWLWRGMDHFFEILPLIQGGANLCLYASFPFVLLSVFITQKFHLFISYGKIFVWVKSWILTGALAFYASLIIARFQAQTSPNASWFWQSPLFCASSIFLIVLMPVLTLLTMNYGLARHNKGEL
jgi:hypothetical protein